jgi:hypothetical protein
MASEIALSETLPCHASSICYQTPKEFLITEGVAI